MNQKVYQKILAERDRQIVQWGGADHDDSHQYTDWFSYIEHQVDLVRKQNINSNSRLVKIAALAIAGLESAERKAKP